MDNIVQIQRTADNSTMYWAKVGDFGFCLDIYDDGGIVLLVKKGEKTECVEIKKVTHEIQ